jgi:hypothetical protein
MARFFSAVAVFLYSLKLLVGRFFLFLSRFLLEKVRGPHAGWLRVGVVTPRSRLRVDKCYFGVRALRALERAVRRSLADRSVRRATEAWVRHRRDTVASREAVWNSGRRDKFYSKQEAHMGFGRGALLWLLGVPLPIIILLALFWHH